MDKIHENVSLMVGIMCCLVLIMFECGVNAFTHIVGGNHGWRVPPNITFFDQWAASRTFGVGDRLVFPYRPGADNLLVVKKPDYEACEQNEVINMYFLGPTILNLTEPGDYYYYDGIGKHCEAGQKLHIRVGSKEGTSGSDPLPFNLQTFGIQTTFDSKISTQAPAPTAPSSSAVAHKFGFASSRKIIIIMSNIAMALFMFL